MNRSERRAHNARLKRLPKQLTPVDESEWPKTTDERVVRRAVWRSRYYLAQVFEEPNHMLRISVSRATVRGDGRWDEDLTWDELQRIKNEIGLGQAWALECYPADAQVVNVANMRHLWVLPEGVEPTFGWNLRVEKG